MITLGKTYFGLDTHTNMILEIADARPFLLTTRNRYDLIEIDLFSGSGEIPFYLATKEFFSLTERRLTDPGLMAMNIYDPSPDGRILRPLLNTIASVYPYVWNITATLESHFVLAGTKAPDFTQLEKQAISAELLPIIHLFSHARALVPYRPDETVFTDNLSAMELFAY